MDKRNGNSLLAGPAACALCEVRGLLGMKQPNRRRGPIINPSSASSNVLLARGGTARPTWSNRAKAPRGAWNNSVTQRLSLYTNDLRGSIFMKRLFFIGLAASLFAISPTFSVSAMPAAPLTAITDSDSATIQIKHGHGHKWGHRGGRGHHYGWGRGRGHHHGWRHHHRRW